MSTCKSRAIKPGDTLSIVSPASPIEREKLEPGIRLLEERGYKLKFGEHAFERDGFIAGSDEQRAADLQYAWFDEETTAVICTRGGYGCSRLLGRLDLDAMAQRPKLLVGFSDLTVLHLALNRRGLATLYAPMLLSFVKPRAEWVIQMWFDAMEGRLRVPPPEARGETLAPGVAEGQVTGGCLCLLCDSVGTAEPLDASNKIVLIEDVDEAPHRIDAMLTHLLNAGILQKAAGIVVGEMTGSDAKMDEGIGGKPWMEIVAERLSKLSIPIVVGFPFGHQEHMSSLPMGIRARLDASNGTLEYLERGVSLD